MPAVAQPTRSVELHSTLRASLIAGARSATPRSKERRCTATATSLSSLCSSPALPFSLLPLFSFFSLTLLFLLSHLFSFFFHPLLSFFRSSSRGGQRAVWWPGPSAAMDGGSEPTWMYLRRVLDAVPRGARRVIGRLRPCAVNANHPIKQTSGPPAVTGYPQRPASRSRPPPAARRPQPATPSGPPAATGYSPQRPAGRNRLLPPEWSILPMNPLVIPGSLENAPRARRPHLRSPKRSLCAKPTSACSATTWRASKSI
jgi:hypothetical protein